MKKSDFIKLALNDISNTLFVNEEQVKVAVELFEKLGMGPVKILEKRIFRDMECMPYEEEVYVNRWELEE
jgi:hypothetical protein